MILEEQNEDPSRAFSIFSNIITYNSVVNRIDNLMPGWLRNRQAEYEILVALPRVRDLAWSDYFSLSDQEMDSECRLSVECAKIGMLGINRHAFVSSNIFQLPSESRGSLDPSGNQNGWTDQQMSEAESLLQKLNDVRHRTIGGAGMVAFHPEFRRECNELRGIWESLPEAERPSMPLERPPQFADTSGGNERPENENRSQLYRQFEDLCEKWGLLAMTSWDLPIARGPNLSGVDPLNPSPPAGTVSFDIPPHFRLLTTDHMGKTVQQQHLVESSEMGFDDLGQWQEYAHLLRIHFLQRVVASRYSARPRPKAQVARLRSLLAAWLYLDEERVKKLQRDLRRKLNGDDHSQDK